jgi:hypothetical protein
VEYYGVGVNDRGIIMFEQLTIVVGRFCHPLAMTVVSGYGKRHLVACGDPLEV